MTIYTPTFISLFLYPDLTNFATQSAHSTYIQSSLFSKLQLYIPIIYLLNYSPGNILSQSSIKTAKYKIRELEYQYGGRYNNTNKSPKAFICFTPIITSFFSLIGNPHPLSYFTLYSIHEFPTTRIMLSPHPHTLLSTQSLFNQLQSRIKIITASAPL